MPSPDSTSKSKRRKVEDLNEDSNSCPAGHQCTTRSNTSHGELGERFHTSSSSRSGDIPTKTSRWSVETSSVLKVKVAKEKCPHIFKLPLPDSSTSLTVFDKWLDNLLCHKHGSAIDSEIDYLHFLTYFKKIKTHISAYPVFNRLDVDSIHEMKQKDIFDHIETDLMLSANDFASKISALKDMDPVERAWRRRFIGSVEDFTTTLKSMLTLDNISEAYYRQLFLHFIGMFGVRGWSVPCVPTQHIKIGDINESSEPDILLHTSFGVSSAVNQSKLLAIVEVKEKNEEPYNPTPAKNRSEELFGQQEDEFSINDKLIGQHAGDLLLQSHLSASSSGLIGMIVQETHITFTHLSFTNELLKKIKSGNVQNLDGPSELTFSRSYNFLKASDNKELMEPLLILGLLQLINRVM